MDVVALAQLFSCRCFFLISMAVGASLVRWSHHVEGGVSEGDVVQYQPLGAMLPLTVHDYGSPNFNIYLLLNGLAYIAVTPRALQVSWIRLM